MGRCGADLFVIKAEGIYRSGINGDWRLKNEDPKLEKGTRYLACSVVEEVMQ